MNINYFFINKETNTVIGPNIETNEKIKKSFSLEEVKALVDDLNVIIFVNRHENLLEPFPQEEVIKKWDIEFAHNINTSDSGSVEDYPNGYFYYVDVWKMEGNINIVVFSLNH